MLPKIELAAALFLLICVVSTEATLNDRERTEVLSAHNHYRRNVYPTANNMAKMVWDSELAILARFWSVRCEMMDNENRHEQSSEFDYVGQNMAATGNYSYNLTTFVTQWYQKGENYDYFSLTCQDDDDDDNDEKREAEEEDECQPYTQLVWAETYKIGCAKYRCDELRGWDDENEDNENALLFVCYYGPGGSFQGEKPYVAGDACTGCPSNQPLCEDGLCTGGQSGAPAHVSIATILLLLGVMCTLV